MEFIAGHAETMDLFFTPYNFYRYIYDAISATLCPEGIGCMADGAC